MRPQRSAGLALLLLLCVCALLGCKSMDFAAIEKTPSSALQDPSGTRLGEQIAPQLIQRPGQSGFIPLERGLDAFVARAALAEAAQRTLDLQYYIVRGDTSGRLLLSQVFAAAERGVRVRLLLDDWTLADADEALAQLDAHPLIEIRLFNPTANRGWLSLSRWFEIIGDFARINRRMHNKAWIADNSAGIIGGRNLGDEYFEASPDLEFADLDLLFIGPAVREASASFDRYWNSEFAVPLSAFLRVAPGVQQRLALQEQFAQERQRAAGTPFVKSLERSPLAMAVRQGSLPFVWAPAKVLADDPAKLALPEDDPALKQAKRGLLLTGQLDAIAPKVMHELLVVSPYFVPGESGVASLAALSAAGVRVRVLTNSLASNDVVPTQAGYARYRRELLEKGIELYELKPSAGKRTQRHPVRETLGGSSRAALHEKSFVVDRKWVFVGSLNLDPRSIRLNAEIGVLVHSAELAQQIADAFEQNTSAQRSWRMELREGEVVWVDAAGPQALVHTRDPDASVWRRLSQAIYRLIAPESQL